MSQAFLKANQTSFTEIDLSGQNNQGEKLLEGECPTSRPSARHVRLNGVSPSSK